MNLLSKYSKHSDYLPIRSETHLKWYVCFLESRRNRVIPEGVPTEVHHIVPIDFLPCDWLGFQKDEKNTIRLTTREHIIAHMILEKVTEAPSMTYAYNMMVNTRNAQGEIIRLTTREAANLRERFRIVSSESQKGEKSAWWGRCHTDETKEKISKKQLDSWKTKDRQQKLKDQNDRMRNDPHHFDVMSKRSKGKIWVTKQGENRFINPKELDSFIERGFKEGLDSDWTESSRESLSTLRKKQIWITKGGKNKAILFSELINYEKEGWSRGMVFHKAPVRRTNSNSMTGRVIVNDGFSNKVIYKTELEEFLRINPNFKKGRLWKQV